ncbi:MAG: hypothetical protein JWQ04_1824 [Pedosphaera sp.]|nr:hypothetical protein [Pedosphaera sp.]
MQLVLSHPWLPMNLTERLRSIIRDLFAPGPAAFDERRSRRILILSTLAGIIIAIGIGFVLYYLNTSGRLRR